MTLIAVIAVLVLSVWVSQAQATLSVEQLERVAVSPPAGARLEPSLAAPDAHGRRRTLGNVLDGRPAFINFVDFACTTLCGTDLELLSQAIVKNRLDPSRYRIILVGIRPKNSAQAALAMERKEIPAALWPDTTLLLPDERMVRHATAALGFHYVYDPDIDQFAHPAVVFVLAPDGELRRTLSPFALGGTDLRQVLESRVPQPDLFQRVRLLCYAYDPATGVYTLRILALLKIACIATVLALAGTLIFLRRFRRRTA